VKKAYSVQSHEDIQFLTLGIELYCAILEEMGFGETHAGKIKTSLLNDLERDPISFGAIQRRSRMNQGRQSKTNGPQQVQSVEPNP
jgi:hypothetical protein